MNGRRLTDAQISTALRAHLPEAAAPGVRERVLDAAETTAQLRSFPSLVGGLTDADPVARRRSLLIAAALLVALALASATAVGAWRLLQRDPIHELSLEPPADLPAFVLSSYERLPQLPPVALTWHDSDSNKGRIYVDRSGAVRFDRFVSADATEPSSYTILNGNHRVSGMAPVESEAVWIEQGHEAIGDDPRRFIRGILNSGGSGPGCEVERDPSEVGNGNAATGWRYVGVEYVAGRPTHHVACVGDLSLDLDLWLDIETRLILRARGPLTDDAGQPIPGQFSTTEVTEIAFGEQPAALFEPPEGVTRMSEEAYGAYLCAAGDLPNEEVVGLGTREGCPTEAEATPRPAPTPMPTARPSPSDCAAPSSGPSQPAGSLAWTQPSLKEDWPAPVRPEPAGRGSVQPMPLTYFDPTGDTGSDVLPCVDIRAVIADTSSVDVKLVSNQPPVVDPAQRWIAYGVVTDDDRDGVADWRYGTDNTPAEPTMDGGDTHTRWWRTNLHTGQTDAGPMDGPGSGDWLSAPFRPEYPNGSDASFAFGGALETTRGSAPWGIDLDMPFYAWSSVIVNGRVVATDYAPDAGWLVATRGAKPGGTYLLEDDFQLPLSMTLPDGWMGGGAFGGPGFGRTRAEVIRDARQIGDVAIRQSGVLFVVLGDDSTDDCAGEPTGATYGPGVDDVVRYLADQPKTVHASAEGSWTKVSIDISENKDVILDGYRGAYVEYEIAVRGPVTYESGPCGWPSWKDQHSQVWIIDVDGVRLVIDASSPPGAPETVRAELRQAVESIHLER
jgi:hypothetical protein